MLCLLSTFGSLLPAVCKCTSCAQVQKVNKIFIINYITSNEVVLKNNFFPKSCQILVYAVFNIFSLNLKFIISKGSVVVIQVYLKFDTL